MLTAVLMEAVKELKAQNQAQKEALKKQHFDRWLLLFNETVNKLFVGNKAELAKTRALSIATIMQVKIHQSLN